LQVGYATALDVFIILCFITVFAALVEFAILNFIDTLVRRIKRKDRDRATISSLIGNAHNVFGPTVNQSIPKGKQQT
jgi:predicted PurR-regulated permease PerM